MNGHYLCACVVVRLSVCVVRRDTPAKKQSYASQLSENNYIFGYIAQRILHSTFRFPQGDRSYASPTPIGNIGYTALCVFAYHFMEIYPYLLLMCVLFVDQYVSCEKQYLILLDLNHDWECL